MSLRGEQIRMLALWASAALETKRIKLKLKLSDLSRKPVRVDAVQTSEGCVRVRRWCDGWPQMSRCQTTVT